MFKVLVQCPYCMNRSDFLAISKSNNKLLSRLFLEIRESTIPKISHTHLPGCMKWRFECSVFVCVWCIETKVKKNKRKKSQTNILQWRTEYSKDILNSCPFYHHQRTFRLMVLKVQCATSCKRPKKAERVHKTQIHSERDRKKNNVNRENCCWCNAIVKTLETNPNWNAFASMLKHLGF